VLHTQGYDDIGLHNPSYVKTPNLDKFMRRCAQQQLALYWQIIGESADT
jgi:hypothetical protein